MTLRSRSRAGIANRANGPGTPALRYVCRMNRLKSRHGDNSSIGADDGQRSGRVGNLPRTMWNQPGGYRTKRNQDQHTVGSFQVRYAVRRRDRESTTCLPRSLRVLGVFPRRGHAPVVELSGVEIGRRPDRSRKPQEPTRTRQEANSDRRRDVCRPTGRVFPFSAGYLFATTPQPMRPPTPPMG